MKEIKEFSNQYRFLSNFYPSPFTIDDRSWKTVEHYYQAMKSIDIHEQEKIRKLKYPGEAKRYGQKVKLRSDWNDIKIDIMKKALLAKFKQNISLKELLLETNDCYLIEGNYWHDNIWGICYCKKCENIKGENRLGKLLMKIRNNFIK